MVELRALHRGPFAPGRQNVEVAGIDAVARSDCGVGAAVRQPEDAAQLAQARVGLIEDRLVAEQVVVSVRELLKAYNAGKLLEWCDEIVRS